MFAGLNHDDRSFMATSTIRMNLMMTTIEQMVDGIKMDGQTSV